LVVLQKKKKMKITFASVLCLSACLSLPPSDIVVWAFCFLFPSKSRFELLLRALCLLVVVFPAFALCLGSFLAVLCCLWVWLCPSRDAGLKGNDEEDGDDHNSGHCADEEGDEVAGASFDPALALASATILDQAAVVPSVGVVSLPALPAGEQVINDLLSGLDASVLRPAPADSGVLSVADFPAGDLDFDQVISDLLSGLDASVFPVGDGLFVPAATAAIGDDYSAFLLPASDGLFAPAATAAIGDDDSAFLLPAGEGFLAPAAAAAIGNDGPAPLFPAAVDDALFLGLFDLDADFDGIVSVPPAAAEPAPIAPAGGLEPDEALDELLLGLLAFDVTLGGLVPAFAGADDAPDDGGTETPPLAVTAVAASDVGVVMPRVPVGAAAADDEAIVLPPVDDDAPNDGGVETPPLAVTAIDASDVGVVMPPVPAAAAAADNAAIVVPPVAAIAAPNDGGVVSPGLAAAMPPAAPAVQENDEAVAGEPVPMDVDSDDQDDHILDDPMDIQEDATMTLRRGGWRRVTPLLVHGRRRRIMALPPGVPAHRFAGPYTVPWYQGSSSYGGRRRNTWTGARVKTVF
jgi:hypothetical protein